MLKRLRTLFAPPVFPENEDKTRQARYANTISLTFFAAVFGYETFLRLTRPIQAYDAADFVLVTIAVVTLVGLALLRRGHVRLTSFLLVGLVWLASNAIAASGYGIRDTSFIINFAIMLMAGLLIGWRVSIAIAVLSIFVGFGLAYAEMAGLLVTKSYPVTSFAQDIAVVFILSAVLIYLLINGLENAIKQSRVNLKELETTNADLNSVQTDLYARTSELSTTNQLLQERTERLRAVAEVARIASSIQDFDILLPQITSAISKQLGFYHAGIFLVDEQKQYAILRSANTAGGLRMLARGHRLKLGEQGIVGFVTQTGTPRIALDVGQDAVFFNNPELPETRSELALPLKVGSVVIGALDLQSTEANAFDDEDVSVLAILADQVAIAIQNSLSVEQARRALREAEVASRLASGQAWKVYSEKIRTRGYRYDGIKPEPLKEAGKSVEEKDVLLVPVQIRGQTIGSLKLKPSEASRKWTEDERAIIESTAERVALAIEGARLLDEAQKRAARETFLSEIAAKLGTSFQLDSILRDTVEELGHTLKDSTVSFQLVNPSAPATTGPQKPDGLSVQMKKPE
jgi:GAF domain-containing protein